MLHYPYYNTYLQTEIILQPYQLNSNIIDNIKQNIIARHKDKCFYNLGYISEVYSILTDKISSGLIYTEDNDATVNYEIWFKARLCNPLIETNIIGKIININKRIICASNGPMTIIIRVDQIDKSKFSYNLNNNIIYCLNEVGKEIKDKIISENSYASIMVLNKKTVNNTPNIFIYGQLYDLIDNADTISKYYTDH